MKILLICESWDLSAGPYVPASVSFAPILRRFGHDVRVVDNKRNYLYIGGQTAWDYPPKLARLRWGLLNDLIVNCLVIRAARLFQPDFIFFSKCENIHPRTITKLQQLFPGAALLNWYGDNPFYYGATSMYALTAMSMFDVYGIWNKQLIQPLYSVGCKRVEYIPWFYDPVFLKGDVQLSESDRREYTADISFVGNWSPRREQMLAALADYDFAIWGSGWEKVSVSSPLRKRIKGRQVKGDDYTKVLRLSKILVHVFNYSTQGSGNQRVFETTGVGRLLLSEYTDEVGKDLFLDGREVVCFHDLAELKRKADYYLSHDEEREQIANAGRERTLREHTVEKRLRQVVEVAEEIRAQKSARQSVYSQGVMKG